ncbi:unnamed protein product [Sphagnum jensenii]|uniref:Uncharacterized protein n=1 Tax=Sphagnum jensenii TaxID=128206 RepID=A0ABP1ADE8_9BRYO
MGGRWRRRRRSDHDNNNSSSTSNGGRGVAMDFVMIFWHNPLLILAVILLFTPPLYPLLVYFSPLLMSTALCVAALLSIKGHSSEVGDPTVVVAAAAAASSSSSSGPPHSLHHHHHHHHRRHDDSSDATAAAGAGTWIRVSDVVLADSVSSVAASSASSFAAHRYEHLVDWSGESQVQRVWSWSTDRAVDSAIQQQSRALRSSSKSSEEEQQQEKDRWTTWVKEYEARPEWNEATAPPSQDGGFAAAVKREQEMRLEKEALKLETEKFRERFKIAAIKANLHRRQKTSAVQDEEEAAAVLRQTKPDALAKRHFFDAQTLLSIERFLFTETDAGADPSLPTKTEVPAAQGFHQPKTAAGACVRRERHGSNVEDEEEFKTSGEQKQQQLSLSVARYLSSESLSGSSTASRGKQVSPRLLHIPLKASSDNGVVGKQSSTADKRHAESTSEEDDSSDDQESDADDDDYDYDDDDDSSDHSEIRKLLGMENRSLQQSSEPNPSVVQDLMMPSSTSCSYKASSNSTIGFNVQRLDQHSGTQVDNTPDTMGDSDSDSSSSSSSQAFHHYTLKTDCHPLESADHDSQEKDKGSISLEKIKITQKTDCHALENADCGSQEKDKGSISLERIEITQKTDCHALENADRGSQEKDKGSISLERTEITQKTDCHALENTNCGSQEKDKGNIALEKIEIARMQSRRQLKSGRSFVSSLEESCNSQQRSSSLQIASISSLDHRRRSTTTSTLKPLVWRSRSSDSPEMED